MIRLSTPWGPWIALYLVLVVSALLVLVEIQNIRSIHDRAYMHNEIQQLRADARYLRDVVEQFKSADAARRRARP